MSAIKLSVDLTPMAVCRVDAADKPQALKACAQSSFSSMTQTQNELSVVCDLAYVQESWKLEKTWNRLEVQGPLDFSMVGVLSQLSAVLAQKNISIFVVSTFDTDHILVKDTELASAVVALKSARYTFV